MSQDEDNAGEVVAAAVRVAMTAAGQLAEHAARRRESALRDAERESGARVATVQAQLAAERQLALHAVRDLLQRSEVGASQSVTVEAFVAVRQQIASWGDPVAQAELGRLDRFVQDRFGVTAAAAASGDRGVAVEPREAKGVEQSEAAALIAQDVVRQSGHVVQRTSADRDLGSWASDAGEFRPVAPVETEAQQARALAAQSHPTSPALAARAPSTAPRARRRNGRQQSGVEVANPGR